jgi:putative oxidoreductase
MKIGVIVARVLLGVIFVFFGANGFLQFLKGPMPAGLAGQFLTVLFQSHWVLAVSAVQVVGGLLLLVNRYVPLALALLGPVIVNIILFHSLISTVMWQPAALVTILWFFLFYRYRANFAGLFVAKAE